MKPALAPRLGLRLFAAALLLLGGAAGARADDVYQEPEAFLSDVFGGNPPAPEALWITGELKPAIESIMGHGLGVLRVRYWGRDKRTAWILEEIGKERPITTGIVVESGRIEQIKVLIYRESRGYEVRYPVFTDQFRDARLAEGGGLTRNIDGISGATLSVRALTRLAQLALFLHSHTSYSGD